MPEVHQLGPKAFWHPIALGRKHPLVYRSRTQETETPFRNGASLVLRIPCTRVGVVVGRWSGRLSDEESALMAAVQGRKTEDAPAAVREWDASHADGYVGQVNPDYRHIQAQWRVLKGQGLA